MRKLTGLSLAVGSLLAVSFALAQNPATADGLVARMMAYDKDGDGKLTKSEVTDERLHRLLDRADVDKDGAVTKAELTALEAKESASFRRGPDGPGGFGPPGGPGGAMMGPPRPGEILPSFLQRALNLTADQKSQLDELQKDVDSRLAKILTDAQKKMLDQMAPARPWRARRPRWLWTSRPSRSGPGPVALRHPTNETR